MSIAPELLTIYALQEHKAWQDYQNLVKAGQRNDLDLIKSARLRWETLYGLLLDVMRKDSDGSAQ